MTPSATDFPAFFRAATGHDPYDYQRALGESDHQPPAALDVPTGAGKTQALIVSWLHGRREHKRGPRRLVYALPMRTLVEQTRDVACEIRDRLKLSDDDLSIRVLMGGVDQAELREWEQSPERDQILIGTIDMLLSRALNRGYATSRFMWPVAFGLLNNDCRWVFDEVQLMGSARATSAQLDGLRASLGTVLACETVWVSATLDRHPLQTIDRPRLGDVASLPESDRSGALSNRLNANKTLRRIDLEKVPAAGATAAVAQTALDHHVEGTRTLMVLNTVNGAQAVYRELRRLKAENVVLLHSRFRPGERAEHMRAALAQPDGAGTIVVATQVIEAGVDVSARTLISETAPFSSIVQRLGRCNREGEFADADVVWLDRGPLPDEPAGQKAAAPYAPQNIEATRTKLLELVGTSLSPATLERIDVDEAVDDPTVLRRRDLIDLFDTSPDLSGMDIDIAPFIRDDDDRNVSVFFRDIGDEIDADNIPAPERDELVQAPRFSFGKRPCWTIDHVQGEWVKRSGNEIPPGATVMLRAADGGYNPEIGWDGKSKGAVEPIPLTENARPEGMTSDRGTESKQREELLPHLEQVADEAATVSDALELGDWREILRCAGALHDIGKAHFVFQDALRKVMSNDAPSGGDGVVWAKSGTRKRINYKRRYFRHELASALAIRLLGDALDIPRRELTAYLVAAHHGKVRLSIRPSPEERRPDDAVEEARFALGIVDGDALPAVRTPLGDTPQVTLNLEAMEFGPDSWTNVAVRLRDDPDLGPFRLGFLEALLRVADWRASGA